MKRSQIPTVANLKEKAVLRLVESQHQRTWPRTEIVALLAVCALLGWPQGIQAQGHRRSQSQSPQMSLRPFTTAVVISGQSFPQLRRYLFYNRPYGVSMAPVQKRFP
jgi:hypothetical protein